MLLVKFFLSYGLEWALTLSLGYDQIRVTSFFFLFFPSLLSYLKGVLYVGVMIIIFKGLCAVLCMNIASFLFMVPTLTLLL